MGTEALPPVTLNGFPNKSLYIQTTIKSISLKIAVMDITIRLFWSWVPMKIIDFSFLRTPVRKYREFRDSTKKSIFFLIFEKVPFDQLFSKQICKRSSAFYFLRNEENSKMRPDRPRSAQIAVGNYAK